MAPATGSVVLHVGLSPGDRALLRHRRILSSQSVGRLGAGRSDPREPREQCPALAFRSAHNQNVLATETPSPAPAPPRTQGEAGRRLRRRFRFRQAEEAEQAAAAPKAPPKQQPIQAGQSRAIRRTGGHRRCRARSRPDHIHGPATVNEAISAAGFGVVRRRNQPQDGANWNRAVSIRAHPRVRGRFISFTIHRDGIRRAMCSWIGPAAARRSTGPASRSCAARGYLWASAARIQPEAR